MQLVVVCGGISGGGGDGGAACVQVMGPGPVSGEQVLVPRWPPEAPGRGGRWKPL